MGVNRLKRDIRQARYGRKRGLKEKVSALTKFFTVQILSSVPLMVYLSGELQATFQKGLLRRIADKASASGECLRLNP
jgi:hypothetical protein